MITRLMTRLTARSVRASLTSAPTERLIAHYNRCTLAWRLLRLRRLGELARAAGLQQERAGVVHGFVVCAT
jgi:hypothetical protein